MASSALDQYSYDTSSPMSYDEWQDQVISKDLNTGNGWKDFWNGVAFVPRAIAGRYGQKGYSNYTEDFYNKQEIKNAQIAENRQRAYETEMSNTAYQRAYKDIQATGLNPAILLNSAFGSATTPSSSLAYQRKSSNSRNTSESESRNKSFSASAVLAALLFLLTKI